MIDQVVINDAEDNVAGQDGVAAADDGNPATPHPMALCTRLMSSLGSCLGGSMIWWGRG
jgi:hypothetical protein